MERAGTQLAEDWYTLGSAALDRRNLRAAKDAFDRAVSADPAHANALFRLGQIAESRHEFEQAAKRFRDALAADPGHARARQLLTALEERHPAPPPPPDRPGPA